MIDKFSKEIAKTLVQEDIVKFDDYEVCIYGLEVFLVTFIEFIGLMILGILCRCPIETIIFIIFFSSLRVSAGGFHANKWYECFIIICLFTFGSIYAAYKIQALMDIEVILIMLILSLLILLKYAPVDTKNNPLTKEEKRKQRKVSLITFSIQSLIIIFLYLSNIAFLKNYLQIAAMAVMIETLTLVNFSYKNRGAKE